MPPLHLALERGEVAGEPGFGQPLLGRRPARRARPRRAARAWSAGGEAVEHRELLARSFRARPPAGPARAARGRRRCRHRRRARRWRSAAPRPSSRCVAKSASSSPARSSARGERRALRARAPAAAAAAARGWSTTASNASRRGRAVAEVGDLDHQHARIARAPRRPPASATRRPSGSAWIVPNSQPCAPSAPVTSHSAGEGAGQSRAGRAAARQRQRARQREQARASLPDALDLEPALARAAAARCPRRRGARRRPR